MEAKIKKKFAMKIVVGWGKLTLKLFYVAPISPLVRNGMILYLKKFELM